METSQLFVCKTENVSKPEKKMATFVLIHAPIYKCKRNLAFYLLKFGSKNGQKGVQNFGNL